MLPGKVFLCLFLSLLAHLVLFCLLYPSNRNTNKSQPLPIIINLASSPATSPQKPANSPAAGTRSFPDIPTPSVQTQPVSPRVPAVTVSPLAPIEMTNRTRLPSDTSSITSTPAASVKPVITIQRAEDNGKIAADTTFGSVNGPSFRTQIQPSYPALAKRRTKQGTVLLRLSISETGQLTSVEVLENPGYGFAEAALEAVYASSFTPGYRHGKPVAMQAILPIRFTLH